MTNFLSSITFPVSMCGRYTITFTIEEALEAFNAERVIEDFAPNFNAAPTQDLPVIIKVKGKVVLDLFRWGLIPHWAKDMEVSYKMINARAETVAEKPSYKGAFLNHRCLVPASGFFEWEKTETGKVPHYITLKDRKIFAFAGISSTWTSPEGETINSFSIVTTTANPLMLKLHDRMPVIIPRQDEKAWLDNEITDIERLKSLMVPYDAEEMQEHAVSSKVNSPKNNAKELLEPLQSFNQALDKWV